MQGRRRGRTGRDRSTGRDVPVGLATVARASPQQVHRGAVPGPTRGAHRPDQRGHGRPWLGGGGGGGMSGKEREALVGDKNGWRAGVHGRGTLRLLLLCERAATRRGSGRAGG
ncbi:hypothetical protein AMAG_18749 [Allomyces macrogynus ATCC 38327]|uniref:Uncharacterized protein n=1 Tax=Allomyces macrogynus (strain ATCC 38327) TaxID=578462 RepID=A0A0L0SF71_ALLM3|nr:hypothetical protein AMAG_18749 [Allomyces macrogynus ATCC 38327]|eukprot:KNE61151.1 hypothetical protein AMAG_18749 [Allomyces macrogynus ATCC 38327]